MSYIPTNWRKGDIVTAELLNKMERGIASAGSGGGGGGGSVLVVNATIDYEHAESEEQIPLILDKTMDEMLAAEYTVLLINAGEGEEEVEAGAAYECVETYRAYSEDGGMKMGTIYWGAEFMAMKFTVVASSEGGVVYAILTASESGYTPPDETDEFIVRDSLYFDPYGNREYHVYSSHLTSDINSAKNAIFTFDFNYSPSAETLTGTADARLAYSYESIDGQGNTRAEHIYEATVEKSGALWCVTVTRTEVNGSTTCSVSVTSYPLEEVLVAHTEIYDLPSVESTESITLDKTFAELAAAQYSVIKLDIQHNENCIYIPLAGKMFSSDEVASCTYVFEEAGTYLIIEVDDSSAGIMVSRNPLLEPFVLTSTNFDMTTFTGPIDQTYEALAEAYANHRRIFVQLFGTKAELTVVGNNETTEAFSSTFIFDTGALAGVVLAKAIVYVDATDPNEPVLMLRAEMYSVTPLVP